MSDTVRPETTCAECGQGIHRHSGTGTGWRHDLRAERWCDHKAPTPGVGAEGHRARFEIHGDGRSVMYDVDGNVVFDSRS